MADSFAVLVVTSVLLRANFSGTLIFLEQISVSGANAGRLGSDEKWSRQAA